MVKKVIISPPFGTYVELPWATSVKGSFTLHRRPGLPERVIKTLRPTSRGWVNKIGLRNPGIKSITKWRTDVVYSLAVAEDPQEWLDIYNCLFQNVPVLKNINLELNVSCPNVHARKSTIEDIMPIIKRYNWVSVKLPPTDDAYYWINALSETKAVIHLSNTVPTPAGGLSGRHILEKNMLLLRYARSNTNLPIIAGGGIYSPLEVEEYAGLGADYISLATVFLSPWRFPGVFWALKKQGFID